LTAPGDATVELLNDLFGGGVESAVVLIRHSAREFAPGRHDLANPLTQEGRDLARRLGERLPKGLTVRAYASPPERCMETAELVLAGYSSAGGQVTRHRPVEALGVFYALDQMKMWQVMQSAGGMVPFLEAWFSGDVPQDAVMPSRLAAALVVRLMTDKLSAMAGARQLDVCVSHDMTLHLVRDRLLGQSVREVDVDFLDGLVAFERAGARWLASHHGEPVKLDPELLSLGGRWD
jgi:broad specificity phosphatase PhoE